VFFLDDQKKQLSSGNKKKNNLADFNEIKKKLNSRQVGCQNTVNKKGKNKYWQTAKKDPKKNREALLNLEILTREEASKEQLARKEVVKQNYESFQKRLPKLKKQRNRKLVSQLVLIFSGFIFAILVMIYIISPFSKLQRINVVGLDNLKAREVVTASKLDIGTGIWGQFFGLKGFTKHVQNSSSRIANVKIKMTRFNEFTIKIKEYAEIFYELDSKNNRYYPILNNGIRLSLPVKEAPINLPVLKNFKANKKNIAEISRQMNKLDFKLQKVVQYVTLAPTDINRELSVLSMRDGNEVKISIEDIGDALKRYPSIASQMNERGVIDMEVGIFSYPFSKKDEEEKRGRDSDIKKEEKNNEILSTVS